MCLLEGAYLAASQVGGLDALPHSLAFSRYQRFVHTIAIDRAIVHLSLIGLLLYTDAGEGHVPFLLFSLDANPDLRHNTHKV